MNLQLRASNAADLKDLEASLATDEDHRGQTLADWTSKNGKLVTFFDETGEPLFHLRLEDVCRAHFQHSTCADRKRRIIAMKEGIIWLKQWARKQGYREIIFNSAAPKLIGFFSRFGFNGSVGEQKVKL